jgi:hypothetical protein
MAAAQAAAQLQAMNALGLRMEQLEQRATAAENREAAANNLVQTLQAQIVQVQAVNPAPVRANNTVRIISDHVAPNNSVILDVDQTALPLTIEIVPIFNECSRKMKLSAGTGMITVGMFSEVVLIILDRETSQRLEVFFSLYDETIEANAVESLSTDFRQGIGYKDPANYELLYPRFVRYCIKYLFTEALQQIVRTNFETLRTTANVMSVTPSAIIRRLESLRQCSRGQREDLFISRSQVFLAYKDILGRAGPRHKQVLSLTIFELQKSYKNIETVNQIVNADAERDHVTTMLTIGAMCDTQWTVTGAPTHGTNNIEVEVHNTYVGTDQVGQTLHSGFSSFTLDERVCYINEAVVVEMELSDIAVLAEAMQLPETVVHAILNQNRNRSQDDSKMTCFFCKKLGHRKADCRSFQRSQTDSSKPTHGRPPNRSARPFSSVFQKESNGKLRRPFKRFKAIARQRTPKGEVISQIDAYTDVDSFAEDTYIHIVEVDSNTISPQNSWDFDYA